MERAIRRADAKSDSLRAIESSSIHWRCRTPRSPDLRQCGFYRQFTDTCGTWTQVLPRASTPFRILLRSKKLGGVSVHATINSLNEILKLERLAQHRLDDGRIGFVDLTFRC